MFGEPVGQAAVVDKHVPTVEARLDALAESAKAATQLAGKIRTTLNTLATNAQAGNVSTVPGQVVRLADALSGLSEAIERVRTAEELAGVRGESVDIGAYAQELQRELTKKGVEITRGPEPYWLAYPAWIKIDRSPKGSIQVTLNGDKLDSVRPSVVAGSVADVVQGKFNAKQFAELLDDVRQVLRRAGATDSSLRLDDIYSVLAMGPGARSSRKEFTRGEFYYSVHRLAEQFEGVSGPRMTFPRSDRSDVVFFDRSGESRRYLTVEFLNSGTL